MHYLIMQDIGKVILVKWNEPYQKLASCDSSGIIFVWIKYEGRWSIELINDRNTPVTHFSWSHDGRMALICYQDGFVLVGSVAGQRYWSSMLNLEATITCGIWTPDDQQVYFGTTSGQIIVMDVHGAMVSQVQLSADVGISSMAWSCEKFKMEEGDDNDPGVTNATERKFILAVSLQNGYIFLLKTFDDVTPIHVDTGLQGPLCMEWSNSREILAVAGSCKNSSNLNVQTEVTSMLKFYNDKGALLYGAIVPCTQTAISALTWGHNDKRIFLATGTQIHIAWVSRRIATLQLLSRLCIHNSIGRESQLPALPLPARIRSLIANLFAQTIRCCVPEASALRDFVSKPPIGSVRLHCTMIRHDEDNNLSSGTCYTLYLEYLGGLVPLLKGKRTSKIRPEFVIFDPQVEDFGIQLRWSSESKSSGSSVQSNNGSGALTDSSDSDREEGCAGSPRMQRRRKRRNKSQGRSNQQNHVGNEGDGDDLAYVDTLPEHVRLVEVTSNIWGTKFKIHGLVNSVPANLGQVTYKTSLLHLQPRQMTLVMTELRDDFPTGPDPTFNPNIFSEDEEDVNQAEDCGKLHRTSIDHSPPIAPMSPRLTRLNRPKSQILNHHIITENNVSNNVAPMPALARTESYEEETLFHMADVVSYCENVRPQCSYGHISTQSNGRSCTTAQSANFMTQYSRTTTTNLGNQRHAISPLCCEVSVPALQSPKNAVAPSDIIFDRPPAQTLLSYSTANYTNTSNNIQQVKSNILSDQGRNGITVNVHLNNDQRKSIIVKDAVDSANKVCHSSYLNENVNFFSSLNNNLKGSACETMNVSNSNKKKDVPQKGNDCTKTDGGDKLKFIDEENNEEAAAGVSKNLSGATFITDSMIRSCSVGYLDLVDAQLVPSDVTLQMLRKDAPKRLVLVNQKTKHKKNFKRHIHEHKNSFYKSSRLKNCGKSKSLDSSDIFPSCEIQNIRNLKNHMEEPIPEIEKNKNSDEKSSSPSPPSNTIEALSSATKRENSKLNFFVPKSPIIKRKKPETDLSNEKVSKSRSRNKQKTPLCARKEINGNGQETNSTKSTPIHTHALSTLESFITRLRDDKATPPSSPRLPRSSPASPAPAKKGKRPQSASPIRKHLLASPLLGRKNRKNKTQESSDDEVNVSGDEVFNGTNYRDLETFQKAQLRQKLKRGKIEPNGTSCNILPSVQRREFVMHNKAPMWNENSQVYQLDFGGRVTQESAKNFQIEFRGKQVMQFGRIDGNAYTLDFQYPFSALQAFAVALANVTQRLK
ncbi:hypothetical protein FQA39_LY00434 [Lamprigera yunnana]|nr:hypothetical protein FQA39_LY00434 [Lamprigera yunnana]